MKPPEKNIGDLISTKRANKNLTQQQLGDLLGLSQQTIYKYENNKSTPKRKTWLKLCEILDIPPADYLHELTAEQNYTMVKEETLKNYLSFEPIANDPVLIDYIHKIKEEKKFLMEIDFGNFLDYLSAIPNEEKKKITQTLKIFLDLLLNQKKSKRNKK